jgi:hypothetical protein
MAAPNASNARPDGGAIPARRTETPFDPRPTSLLDAAPRVINVGLEQFAEDLAKHGVAVEHVRWAPPARLNATLAALLCRLGC